MKSTMGTCPPCSSPLPFSFLVAFPVTYFFFLVHSIYFAPSRPIAHPNSIDRLMASSSPYAATTRTNHPANVLLVGQIYLDTILDVENFPQEDHKLRALNMEQRHGGNIGNTSEVLAQFFHVNVYVMSAIGPRESSRFVVAP